MIDESFGQESIHFENDFFSNGLKEPFNKYYDMIVSIVLGDYEPNEAENDEEQMFHVNIYSFLVSSEIFFFFFLI